MASRTARLRRLEETVRPRGFFRGRKIIPEAEWWKKSPTEATDFFPDKFIPLSFMGGMFTDDEETALRMWDRRLLAIARNETWLPDYYALFSERRDPLYGEMLCESCLVYMVQRAEDSVRRWPFPAFAWAQDLQVKHEKLGEEIERSLPEAKQGCKTIDVWKCPYGEEKGFKLIQGGRSFEARWKEELEPELRRERERRTQNRLCLACASDEVVLEAGAYWCAEHAVLQKEFWNVEPYHFYGLGQDGEFLDKQSASRLAGLKAG